MIGKYLEVFRLGCHSGMRSFESVLWFELWLLKFNFKKLDVVYIMQESLILRLIRECISRQGGCPSKGKQYILSKGLSGEQTGESLLSYVDTFVIEDHLELMKEPIPEELETIPDFMEASEACKESDERLMALLTEELERRAK